MDFRAALVGPRQQPVIVSEGEIGNDTAARLQAFLGANPGLTDRPTILFASPGGTVGGAMTLGRLLRRIHATTVVGAVRDLGSPNDVTIGPAVCAASCVYAVLGGTRRVVTPRSTLGVIRMRFAGSGTDDEQSHRQVVASLRSYVQVMGLDPGFAAYCEDQPDNALHVLTAAEIGRWRIAPDRGGLP